MKKRLLSAMMALLMFVQMIPASALADSQHLMISQAELNAAVALTGLTEDAAGWHDGMKPSPHMNAAQIAGYLEDLLEHDLKGMMDSVQNIEVDLYELSQSDPSRYSTLTGNGNGVSLTQLSTLSGDMRIARDTMSYYYDELVAQSHYIYTNREMPFNAELTEKERIQYGRRISKAYSRIQEIISEVLAACPLWEPQLDSWLQIISPFSAALRSASAQNHLPTLIEALDQLHEPPQITTIFRGDLGIAGAASTRLSRLSAQSSDQHMQITVLSDDDFGVCISGPDGQPLEGVSVTMTDLDRSGYSITSVTDHAGNAVFAVKDFSADSEGYMNVSLSAQKEGYRSRTVSKTTVKKGSVFSAITLQQDNGEPYLSSVTFNGKDAFSQELGVYYSPSNDFNHELLVSVKAQKPCSVELLYTSTEDKPASGGTISITEAGDNHLSFKGDWLCRFKPEETVRLRIAADSGADETFDTQLKVQRGVLSAPLYDQSGAFNNPFTFGALGFTLPSSLPSFLAGSVVNFDLPNKYIPRVGINLDGSAYFAMGMTAGNYTDKNNEYTWKLQDQKDLEARQRAVEKEGYFAKQFAKAQAEWKGQENKKYSFFGGITADAGMFVVLQGRYVQSTADQGGIKGQAMAGLTVSFSAEITTQIEVFFVSVRRSLSASCALMAGIEMDVNWKGSSWPSLHNLRLTPSMTGWSLALRIDLGFAAGIGAKDILSVSVNGYGYVNFLFMLTLDDPGVKVSVGADAYLLVKAMFLKWQAYVWRSGDVVIYDSRDKARSPSAPAMLTAGMEMEIASVSTANPDLLMTAEQKNTATLSMSMPEMKYAELNGHVYGFYLSQTNRLTWINLKTGESGTLEAWYPKTMQEQYKDYAFDIAPAGGHNCDGIVVGVLSAKRFVDKTISCDDGQSITIQEPDPSDCYASLFFVRAKNGALHANTDSDPVWQHVGSKLGGSYMHPQLEVDPYADPTGNHYGVVMTLEADTDASSTICVLHDYQINPAGNPVSTTKANLLVYPTQTDEQYRMLTLAGSAQFVSRRNDLQFLSIYDLEGTYSSSGASDVRLMHSINTTRYELDSGAIPTARVLCRQQAAGEPYPMQTDEVFYLKAESESNQQHRLWGARVEHWNNHTGSSSLPAGKHLARVTLTDYDVAVPATNFQIQTIAGTTYLYWLETVIPEKSGDPGRYLVRGVTYDAQKNLMSESFVIADITPANAKDVPVSLYLANTGTGYYITDSSADQSGAVRGTVYSFPLQLVADLDLENASMEYSLVTAGSYDEMLITLRNTGNVAVAGFDIDVITKDQNKQEKTVQTLHVDCLDESRNMNTIIGGASSTGAPGVYRINGFNDRSNGDEWYLERRITNYADSESASDVSWAQTPVLMPGAVGCYKASVWVAPDWEGETDIRLQLKKIYAVSNWASTVVVDDGKNNSARQISESGELPLIFEIAQTTAGAAVTPLGHAAALARSRESLPVFSTNITFDSEYLDTSEEDLELDHRLYTHHGERMLELTLTNRAAKDERSERANGVILRAFIDGDEQTETFRYTFPKEIVDGHTHTIRLPVSWLKGEADPTELTIEVVGQEYTEAENMDNRFVLKLRDDSLRFLQHPSDCTAIPGENAEFTAGADGGVYPYSYRWQMRNGTSGAWSDIPDADEETLILSGVTPEMDSLQVRCVVTDGNFDQIISTVASLRVILLPETGDRHQLLPWLVAALLSFTGMLLLTKGSKKRCSGSRLP